MIRGKNGAGKSTLLRILAGLERPTSGDCWLTTTAKRWPTRERREWIGVCAPDFHVYEELTAWENLGLFYRLRRLPFNADEAAALLDTAQLLRHQHKAMALASSGMRQRLKLLLASLHHPPLLLLDEPESNLDSEGSQFLSNLVSAARSNGIVIVATNDPLAELQPDRTILLDL